MEKVVVLGGAGFLGSHVADHLSELGYEVCIYDKEDSQWRNNDQKMVVGDICDKDALQDTIAGSAAVYNFAAISDLNEAMDKPVDTVKVNILGNSYILEACRKSRVNRYIFASSVYVNSREGGFYRCSKQAAENYIEEFYKQYQLEYTILRFGSLYGPRSNSSNGLWRIVNSAMEEGVVRYEGSREAMREYIHVYDAARTSVTALDNEFVNSTLVLTGQEPMRVIDLLEMISEILNLKHGVEVIPKKQVGHYIRTPYSFKESIGKKYVPPLHVDLGQGLLQLIEEIRALKHEK